MSAAYSGGPIKLFCSCSRQDEAQMEQFMKQVQVLIDNGFIELWRGQ